MLQIVRHSNTCKVKMAKSAKLTEAVVDQFVFQQQLDVIINKAVKLKLKWNGRCYEGRGSGMDFESEGPEVTITNTGVRG